VKKCLLIVGLFVVAAGVVSLVPAQPPPPRLHRVIEKGTLELVPATEQPELKNEVSIEIVGDERVIRSNGIPNHKTGRFPNRGNPNRILARSHVFRVPAQPQVAERTTPMHGLFGVAINGVTFDTGAGEFFDGERGWHTNRCPERFAWGFTFRTPMSSLPVSITTTACRPLCWTR